MTKREQILESALKLLAENGLQATPMSAIAKAAGTGMGTIYNYFPTKEDLVNAIYLHIKSAEETRIAGILDSTNSLKFRFQQFYGAFVHFYLKHPARFAFMEQFQHSPVICKATKEAGKEGFRDAIALIQQGQKEGIIKNIDLEHLMYFLSGMLSTYVRWLQTTKKKSTPALLEEHLRLVWDAIKA